MSGESGASIATWTGVSRQRIQQILKQHGFVRPPRVPKKPPPKRVYPCFVCGKTGEGGNRKYCSPEHAEAGKTFLYVVRYRDRNTMNVARSALKSSDNPYMRRWAKRRLNGEEKARGRWLMTDSRAYQILAENDMLHRLPPEVKILEPSGKRRGPSRYDRLRRQVIDAGLEPEV